MKRKISFLTFIVLSLTLELNAQNISTDPGWQWGRFNNTFHSFRTNGIETDFDNNIISFFSYEDSVHIEDTSFYHPEGYPSGSYKYFAIVKRNSSGEFIKAVDFHACPGGRLYPAQIAVDKESNIYVYGSFSDTLFVNDSFVVSIYSNYSDVYLLKLDKNFEFQWAKTISSELQDDNRGIAIAEDNYIYISALHLSGSQDTLLYMVNYLNQDSAEYFTGLNSLLKIDPEGHLIWRSEIRDPAHGNADISNTVTGETVPALFPTPSL